MPGDCWKRTIIKEEPCILSDLIAQEGECHVVLHVWTENQGVGVVDLGAVDPRPLLTDRGPDQHGRRPRPADVETRRCRHVAVGVDAGRQSEGAIKHLIRWQIVRRICVTI